MSETLTPETEKHFLPIVDEGKRASGRTPDFCRSLEIDRNRWRSVAEQAETALRSIKYAWENPEMGWGTTDKVEEALSAFDSLRKEESDGKLQ